MGKITSRLRKFELGADSSAQRPASSDEVSWACNFVYTKVHILASSGFVDPCIPWRIWIKGDWHGWCVREPYLA